MSDTAAVNLASQSLFRSEYELEMENWLRRRFRGVCICYMVLTGLILLIRLPIIASTTGDGRGVALLITVLAGVASFAINAQFLFAKHWIGATREQLLRAVSLMIMLLGVISLLKGVILKFASPNYSTDFIVPLLGWHFIACLFLPWTPRESLRPILPLMILWALSVLLLREHDPIAARVLTVVTAPLILIPGLGICSLRLQHHGEKFRSRMVGKQFLSMRRELTRAREIHESMFPAPHDDGFVRFEYTYLPASELGGDYVHVHVGPEGLMHLALLDVTGHGLAAALTVNRLYGELERIRAESPLAEPGEVLTLLNRYVNLTMVKYNIYVTAVCVTLDPYLGRISWSNAGHPPAFLRGANGVVTQLAATAVLLGALNPSEFSAQQQSMELSPGDVTVIYTDGAFESVDRAGNQLGLDSLRKLMHSQPPPRNWSQYIASAVQKHNAGRSDDDILVAAITFRAQRPQIIRARKAMINA